MTSTEETASKAEIEETSDRETISIEDTTSEVETETSLNEKTEETNNTETSLTEQITSIENILTEASSLETITISESSNISTEIPLILNKLNFVSIFNDYDDDEIVTDVTVDVKALNEGKEEIKDIEFIPFYHISAGDFKENDIVYIGIKAKIEDESEWNIDEDEFVLLAVIEAIDTENFKITTIDTLEDNNAKYRINSDNEIKVTKIYQSIYEEEDIIKTISGWVGYFIEIAIPADTGIKNMITYCYNSDLSYPMLPGLKHGVRYKEGKPIENKKLQEELRRALFAGAPINGMGFFEEISNEAFYETQSAI